MGIRRLNIAFTNASYFLIETELFGTARYSGHVAFEFPSF